MKFLSVCFALVGLLALSPIAMSAEDMSVEVWKSPTCGCCIKWVEHLRDNGFSVSVRNVAPSVLSGIKKAAGVPGNLESCHTAKIGNYFIEGHVPADDVKRLMSEKPEGRGLGVPGMPIGSPGMEMGTTREPYNVMLVKKSGDAGVYAQH